MMSIEFQDEPTMTLQVALVGTDGIVLASDTKATAGGGPEVPFSSRHLMIRTGTTEKILTNDAIICAVSGNAAVVSIARELLRAMPKRLGGDIEKNLADLLQIETETILENFGLREHASGQLIVVAPGISKLWEVGFGAKISWVNVFSDRVIGGDRGNPAIFWIERYYSKEKSVDELTMLAAHAVLEGHFLNPSYVAGLNILVCRNSKGSHFLDDGELHALCDHSERIHKNVGASIFTRSCNHEIRNALRPTSGATTAKY